MKLYEVPNGSKIILSDKDGNTLKLTFHYIDGAYSYCTNDAGVIVNIGSWVDVEIAE